MQNTTIEQLKNAGYKVKVFHYRNVNFNAKKNKEMSFIATGGKTHRYTPNGGKTEAIIKTPNNETHFGVAACSVKDNFCRRIGVTKALNRAFGKIDK